MENKNLKIGQKIQGENCNLKVKSLNYKGSIDEFINDDTNIEAESEAKDVIIYRASLNGSAYILTTIAGLKGRGITKLNTHTFKNNTIRYRATERALEKLKLSYNMLYKA